MNKYKDNTSKHCCLKILLLISFTFGSFKSYGQALTVTETIEYLNNLSKENPSSPFSVDNCTGQHYKTYQLKEDGTLIIKEYRKLFDCKNKSMNTTIITITKNVNISDIDISKIEIDKILGGLLLPCKKGDCVKNEIPSQYSGRNAPRNEIRLFETTSYVQEKLQNSLIYLLNIALESGEYRRNDNNDPFARIPPSNPIFSKSFCSSRFASKTNR